MTCRVVASLFDGTISKEMEPDITVHVLLCQVIQNRGEIYLRVCEARSYYSHDINLTYLRLRSFSVQFL